MKEYNNVTDVLKDVKLWNSLDLTRANLSDANLRYANLHGAKLSGANLSGADLYSANLYYADLSRANLRGANLHGANLRYANLRGANLRHANLRYANLYGADLSGANLSCANLSRAKLSDANLSSANLSYANLSGTKLRKGAEWLKENFETDSEGVIVYRTWTGVYECPDHWEEKPGAILEEVPNFSITEYCGCGVNFGTKEWVEREFQEQPIWKCRVAWEDLVDVVVPLHSNGKARCARLTLLEKIN